MNNWPAVQHAAIPLPQSATIGLHPVARNLLLIFHPAEDRRQSWPKDTVGLQIALGCLQMTQVRLILRADSYEFESTHSLQRAYQQKDHTRFKCHNRMEGHRQLCMLNKS